MKLPIMTKSQKRLFLILAIVVSYAVYDLLTAQPKTKIASKQNSSQTDESKLGDSGSSTAVVQSVVPVSFPVSEWRRDPFRKKVVNPDPFNLSQVMGTILVPKLGNLRLTAISRNGNKSYALINDQIVSIGESMNGYKVVDIQSNQVILKKNDFSFTLTLPEDD